MKKRKAKDKNKSIMSRQRFFETTVHNQKVKDCLCGKNEDAVVRMLEGLGYVLSKDFVRQHPIGQRFVLDFAFIPEQIALEIDGLSHEKRLQRISDRKRDSYLRSNNWVALRIKDDDMFGYRASFFKNLIREVVEDRRKQWVVGALFPIDLSSFDENDYE